MAEAGATQLDPDRVIEAQTILGPLWVDRGGEVVTSRLVEDGMWDLTISRLMENVLRPGMTFVDAGANIGYFSVLGSRLVGPTGRVFAVEPDPTNLTILRANLQRQGCSNVTVLPTAAWSERTELDFHRPADGAVARVGQDDGSGLRVPAAPLDELIDAPVGYLKVDCEHSDHVVVAGAERLLAQNPSMLVSVEFHPRHASHLGESPADILERYRALGLHPYEILRKGIRAMTWEEVAWKKLPDGHISFDFVLSRCEPADLRAKGLISRKGVVERFDLERKLDRVLRFGGNLLEHVPERMRPPIRHRDRAQRKTG